MKAVIGELTEVFRTVFDNQDIALTPDTTANDVDGWDSLSHATLVASVEHHFGFRFSRRELASLKNVGDMLKVIEQKR
jgi:acyl carrier protein